MQPTPIVKTRTSLLYRKIAFLAAVLFAFCSTNATAGDKKADLPVGTLKVSAVCKNMIQRLAVIHDVQELAQKYARRAAFEKAVAEQLKKGELKADHLAVTYEDGTNHVFR